MKAKQRFYITSLLFLGLGGAVGTTAQADGTVSVDINQEGQELASEVGIDLAELETTLSTRLSDAFDTLRAKDYLRALSDAVAFSNRGIGVDYASGSKRFQMGIAGNLSVALGDKGLGEVEADRPVASIAPSVSLMLGWNLSEFGYPELTVFGNGFHRSASIGPLSGSATNAGAHAQWRLFQDRGKGSLRKLVFLWGGVDITGGLEFSRMGLNLSGEVETQLPVGSDAMQLDVLATSSGSLRLTTTALTLPIEVTTSIRVLYFFWLYGGIGTDLQLGGSSIDTSLSGSLTAINPNTQENTTIGTVSVSLSEESGPSVGQMRFLGGIQAEVLFLKLFIQGNIMSDRSAGIAFGLRAGF